MSLQGQTRQNIVSSFASSFNDEDHPWFVFGHTGYITLLNFLYLCLQRRRFRFSNGLQVMLLFVKIKYAVYTTYGGLGYKRFA